MSEDRVSSSHVSCVVCRVGFQSSKQHTTGNRFDTRLSPSQVRCCLHVRCSVFGVLGPPDDTGIAEASRMHAYKASTSHPYTHPGTSAVHRAWTEEVTRCVVQAQRASQRVTCMPLTHWTHGQVRSCIVRKPLFTCFAQQWVEASYVASYMPSRICSSVYSPTSSKYISLHQLSTTATVFATCSSPLVSVSVPQPLRSRLRREQSVKTKEQRS